jgi:hypothetical protein
MIPEGRHQCPCCDYYTLDARGSYHICPVCYWEDDGLDLGELDRVSGANHLTLRRARANFERVGAADEAAVGLVASPGERAGLRRELRTEPY